MFVEISANGSSSTADPLRGFHFAVERATVSEQTERDWTNAENRRQLISNDKVGFALTLLLLVDGAENGRDGEASRGQSLNVVQVRNSACLTFPVRRHR